MSQQQNRNATPPGQVVNWPLIFCYFVGLPLELLLHNAKTFGVRSVGPRAGGAVLIMFLFIAFHPNDNCEPLCLFMIAVIVLSIMAQISAKLRQWRGEECHSRYGGRPYAMWLLPKSEITIKRLEPFMALLVGYGIHFVNHPLGSFVMTAAVGLGVRVGVEYRGIRIRSMNIADALIDQKIVMESARNSQQR